MKMSFKPVSSKARRDTGKAIQLLLTAAVSLFGAWFISFALSRHPERSFEVIGAVAISLVLVSFWKPAWRHVHRVVFVASLALLLGVGGWLFFRYWQFAHPSPQVASGTASADARLLIDPRVAVILEDEQSDWLSLARVGDGARVKIAVTVINLSREVDIEGALVTVRITPASGGVSQLHATVDAPGFNPMSRSVILQAIEPKGLDVEFAKGEKIILGVVSGDSTDPTKERVDTVSQQSVKESGFAQVPLSVVPHATDSTVQERVWIEIPLLVNYVDSK